MTINIQRTYEGRKIGSKEAVKAKIENKFSAGYRPEEIIELIGLTYNELSQLLKTASN